MTKLEINKEKAKQLLSEDKFTKLDEHIESFPISQSKKASIWQDFLNGRIMLNMFIEPEDYDTQKLHEIDEDIKTRGSEAILDILSNHKMIPQNLTKLLRKKYAAELLEVKEVIHKRKYYE